MGKDYWEGLLHWMRTEVMQAGMISESDLDIFFVTDDPAEAAELISEFYKEHLRVTNF